MNYKEYIDNIRAKTGKDPEYFQKQAKEKGLVSHAELLAWLKSDCGLGHGHANAIILYIRDPELAKKKIREDAGNEERRSSGYVLHGAEIMKAKFFYTGIRVKDLEASVKFYTTVLGM